MECRDAAGDASQILLWARLRNHLHLRRLFSRKWEKRHGTEVFEKGIRQSRARDEEAQGRDSEERPLRQESHQPQAGDRDWSFRGEGGRQESPEEGRDEKEGRQEAKVEEVTLRGACKNKGCHSGARYPVYTTDQKCSQ